MITCGEIDFLQQIERARNIGLHSNAHKHTKRNKLAREILMNLIKSGQTKDIVAKSFQMADSFLKEANK